MFLNHTNTLKILPIVLGIVIFGLLAALIFLPGKNQVQPPYATPTLPQYTSVKGKTINVDVAPNQLIKSPLRLTGSVPGGWAFEASFPAKLLDSDGRTLWQGAAAVPNWMTAGQTPFDIIITFIHPATAAGTLILTKDNPSGLPEHDDELRIPVRF